MTGRLRILMSFLTRRGPVVVPAAPVPAEALRGPEAFPGVLLVKLRRDVDRLTARAAELEGERDKAHRQRDAFAEEVDQLREHARTVAEERDAAARAAVELAEKLAEYRRVIAAQAGEIRRVWARYEQAHRNTVLEHDRVLTLQKANEDLTRELAELRREAAPYGVIA